MQLNESQEEAYKEVVKFLIDSNRDEFILTGGPGYGKSFLLDYINRNALKDANSVLQVLESSSVLDMLYLTATTNPAANSLEQQVSCGVPTIFSFAGVFPHDNKYISRREPDYRKNVVVIDEYTYLDTKAYEAIRKALPHSKFIYVGDKDQLLAIKGMAPKLNRPPDFTLTIPQRTNDKDILKLTNVFKALVQGKEFTPPELLSDSVSSLTHDEMLQKLMSGGVDLNNSRYITYTNAAAQEYNSLVRSYLNLPTYFQKGERVVVNSTTYVNSMDGRLKGGWLKTGSELFILDQGFTNPLTPDVRYYYVQSHAHGNFWVVNENEVGFNSDLTSEILPVSHVDFRDTFASTVYKAQGSTFNDVYIDLSSFKNSVSYQVLSRSLYVGVSRARNKVYLVGDLSDHLMRKIL